MPKTSETKTQAEIDRIKPPTDRDKVQVPVGDPSGLYIVVYRSGARSFLYQSTVAQPRRFRRRKQTLLDVEPLKSAPRVRKPYSERIGDAKGPGRSGGLTLKEARQLAWEIRLQLQQGIDPREEAEAEEREHRTLQDVWDEYKQLPRFTRGKSYKQTIQRFEKHVLPRLGRKRFADINQRDCEKLHHDVTMSGDDGEERKTAANRALSALSTVFSRMGRKIDNPCSGVERHKERSRSVRLSRMEAKKFLGVLKDLRDQQAADIFWVQLFTGCRRAEVMGMRWSEVDLDLGYWSIPPERTKSGELDEKPLNSVTLPILKRLKEKAAPGSDFVWPSKRKMNGPREYPYAALRKAKELAGLPPELTSHDLRRSFLSFVREAGFSSDDAKDLAGHSDVRVTETYLHADREQKRKVSEAVADWLVG